MRTTRQRPRCHRSGGSSGSSACERNKNSQAQTGRAGSTKKFAGAGCEEKSGCLLHHVGQGRVAVTRQYSWAWLGVSC
eukprot:6186520-Pleurochrysis_carterae.AAC.4